MIAHVYCKKFGGSKTHVDQCYFFSGFLIVRSFYRCHKSSYVCGCKKQLGMPSSPYIYEPMYVCGCKRQLGMPSSHPYIYEPMSICQTSLCNKLCFLMQFSFCICISWLIIFLAFSL
jgi:hypothetical protein